MAKQPDDPKKECWGRDKWVLRTLFPCFFRGSDYSAAIPNTASRDRDEEQDDKTEHTSKFNAHASHDTSKKSSSYTHARHPHSKPCASSNPRHRPGKHRLYFSLCPVFVLALLLTVLQALAILYSVFFIEW